MWAQHCRTVSIHATQSTDRPMQFILLNATMGPLPHVGTELHRGVAESHSVSNNGLIWTFKLRRGVKFSRRQPGFGQDTSIASSDCWRWAREPRGAFKAVLNREHHRADSATVRFVLNKAYAPFLASIPWSQS